MSWDPAILRKFNTTGHFRLLNQLRFVSSRPLPLPRHQAGVEGDAAVVVLEELALARLRCDPNPWVNSRSARSQWLRSPSATGNPYSDAR